MVRCPASSAGGGSRRASAWSSVSVLAALLLLLSALLVLATTASAASVSSGSSQRSACLRNCHLCEQMYGEHFEGHLCAHTCVRLGGRLAPDCTDLASIAPFLADLANIV